MPTLQEPSQKPKVSKLGLKVLLKRKNYMTWIYIYIYIYIYILVTCCSNMNIGLIIPILYPKFKQRMKWVVNLYTLLCWEK
jgi:hypothetical protein